jgi:hypothetical protein
MVDRELKCPAWGQAIASLATEPEYSRRGREGVAFEFNGRGRGWHEVSGLAIPSWGDWSMHRAF